MSIKTARETDEYQWLEETAGYVKSLNLPELAGSGLYDYLVEMGGSDRSSITSQVIRLVMHLLKFRYQPEMKSKSWGNSVDDARENIFLKIKESPSLKRFLIDSIESEDIYQRAKRKAERETGVKMPKENPFSTDEILDDDFYG